MKRAHLFIAFTVATIVVGAGQSARSAQGFLVESVEGCLNQTNIEASLSLIHELPRSGTVSIADNKSDLEIVWHEEYKPRITRLLPTFDRCDDRAHAVAVVLAAIWSTPANPSRDELPPGPPATVARELPSPNASPLTATPLIFAFGVLGTVDGDSAGWGLRSDLTKLGLKGPVGLTVGAEFTGTKATSLGQGSAHWNRTSLIVGPLLSAYSTPSWSLTAEAAAALSLWLVRGEGFDEDRRNFSSAVGASTSMRAVFNFHPVRTFIELRAIAWPGTRKFETSSEPSGQVVEHPLSSWEAQINVGIAFSVRP